MKLHFNENLLNPIKKRRCTVSKTEIPPAVFTDIKKTSEHRVGPSSKSVYLWIFEELDLKNKVFKKKYYNYYK